MNYNQRITNLIKAHNKNGKFSTNKELLSGTILKHQSVKFYKNIDLTTLSLSFEVIKWNKPISNRYEKERRKLAKYHLKAAN